MHIFPLQFISSCTHTPKGRDAEKTTMTRDEEEEKDEECVGMLSNQDSPPLLGPAVSEA